MCNFNHPRSIEEGDLVEVITNEPQEARSGVLGVQGRVNGLNWDAGHWYFDIEDPEDPDNELILIAEEVRKVGP